MLLHILLNVVSTLSSENRNIRGQVKYMLTVKFNGTCILYVGFAKAIYYIIMFSFIRLFSILHLNFLFIFRNSNKIFLMELHKIHRLYY